MTDRPYGTLPGLPDRLQAWAERMETDRSLPWAGLGILDDVQLAADRLRALDDELHREGLQNYEPAPAVALLGREARNDQLDGVRAVLIEQGMLAPDDHDTALGDLVRVLLA